MSTVFAICEAFSPSETSVAERVCELENGLELAVPYTTRPPRSAEDDGFVFMSQDVFERMIANDEFLEHVEIFGHRYGTPRQFLQNARDKGNDLLIRVDESGASQIKHKLADSVSILVEHAWPGAAEPATYSKVTGGLIHRLSDASARSHRPNPDGFDHVVAGDQVEQIADQVIAIIRSERLGRS